MLVSLNFNKLLLQKQVFSVEFVVVCAAANVIIGTPSQLVEFTLIKILHSNTKVEHTAMKIIATITAMVTRTHRLQSLRQHSTN